jgi:hypothetical protein
MGANKEWWQQFLNRIKFPVEGHFMIAPDVEPSSFILVHGETMLTVHGTLDKGESLADCAKLFQEVLPYGKVAAPMNSQKT